MNSPQTSSSSPAIESGERLARSGRGIAEAAAFLIEFEARIQTNDARLAEIAKKERSGQLPPTQSAA